MILSLGYHRFPQKALSEFVPLKCLRSDGYRSSRIWNLQIHAMLIETFNEFLANLQTVGWVGASTLLVAIPIVALQTSESDVPNRGA